MFKIRPSRKLKVIKQFRVVSIIFTSVLMALAANQFADRPGAKSSNQPPVALPDTVNIHGSFVSPVNANALLNDTDPDGDNLTVNYQPTKYVPGLGSFSVGWNGRISGTGGPTPGTAVISYAISDNSGGSASSTVTYNVLNSAPTAGIDFYVITTTAPFTNEVGKGYLANDSDPDGDPVHTFYKSLTSLPNGAGFYSMDGNGNLSVLRSASFSGVVVLGYEVTDSLGASTWGTIVLDLLPIDGANNAGRSCPVVASPVNVTNGNMWLEHTDYVLPGAGESIKINRFYNSVIQSSGLFGFGWATAYDESLVAYGDKLFRLNRPDGRAEYFYRIDTSSPYVSNNAGDQGQIVENPDNSFSLTFKDGRVHDFDSSGTLIRQTDQNGNQTTLAYNVANALTSITDSGGRVLTLTPNSNGTIAEISDAGGLIASYEYFSGTTRLKTVTYPDGSKYKFEYDTTTAPGKVLLKTVKDAFDNIVETHNYDSTGRATTSEVDSGNEKYEFDYLGWSSKAGHKTLSFSF